MSLPVAFQLATGLGFLAKNLLSDSVSEFARGRIRGLLPITNHDMERALAASFREVIAVLESGTQFEQVAAVDLAKGLDAAIGDGDLQSWSLEPALDADEERLREAMWEKLAPRTLREDRSPEAATLRERLPREFLAALGGVVKRKEHRGAWISFTRELLQNLSRSFKRDLGGVEESLGAKLEAIGEKLDRVRRQDLLLEQLASASSETLAALSAERFADRSIAEALELASERQRAGFDRLARAVESRPFYERFPAREAQERVQELIDSHVDGLVGREKELETLDEVATGRGPGKLLVTAGPGMGKTALLANWLARQDPERLFVAHHFFSDRYEATRTLDAAFRNLLRQLLEYYGITGERLPMADASDLRSSIFGVLLDYKARPDRPLVILLDALDEAEEIRSLPFPARLPENVSLIVSSRSGRWGGQLLGAGEDPAKLELGPLEPRSQRDFLTATGDRHLEDLSKDRRVMSLVDSQTRGLPLHLKYLRDDLRQSAEAGEDPTETLLATPAGFPEYVRRQLRRLDRAGLPERAWRLLALLAVAKDELSGSDVAEILGLKDRALREVIGLWEIARWMHVERRDAEELYSLSLSSVRHTLVEALGDEAEEVLDELIAFCSRWSEHGSSYAISHYAAHLQEAGRMAELYDLARDAGFRAEQERRDVRGGLKTVDTALAGAATVGDTVAMTEFVLMDAEIVADLLRRSPLDLMEAGDVGQAIDLAELFPDGKSVLWKALLGWRAGELGDAEAVEQVLSSMRSGPGVELDRWERSALLAIAPRIDATPEEVVRALRSYFNARQLGELAYELGKLAGGEQSSALRLVGRYFRGGERDKGLDPAKIRIARRLAQSESWDQALEMVPKIWSIGRRVQTYAELAQIAAEQKKIVLAMQLVDTLEGIQDESIRRGKRRDYRWRITAALTAIIERFAGDDRYRDAVLEMLRRIERLALRTDLSRPKGALALIHLARAFYLLGGPQKATHLLEKVERVVKPLAEAKTGRGPGLAAEVYRELGGVWFGLGNKGNAILLLQRAARLAREKVQEGGWKAELFTGIAVEYASYGRFQDAQELAERIGEPRLRVAALAQVARSLVAHGRPAEAERLVPDSFWAKAWVLSEMGAGYLEANSAATAREYFEKALRFQLPASTSSQIAQARADLAGAHFRGGRDEAARRSLEDALEVIASWTGSPKAFMMLNTAEALVDAAPKELVDEYLEKTAEFIGEVERPYRPWLLTELAKSLLELGRRDDAMGRLLQAKAITESLKNPEVRARALGELAEGAVAAGGESAGREILDFAEEAAQSIPSNRDRARALAGVALANAKAGFPEKAVELAGIEKVGSWRAARRARVLVHLARGDDEQALRAARRTTGPRERAQAFRDIALSLIAREQPERAIAVAGLITSSLNIELHRLARALLEAREREPFASLLPAMARNWGSAFITVGLLVRSDPARAAGIEAKLDATLERLRAA